MVDIGEVLRTAVVRSISWRQSEGCRGLSGILLPDQGWTDFFMKLICKLESPSHVQKTSESIPSKLTSTDKH